MRWNIKGAWQQNIYAVTKIRNDRKRVEINTVDKKVIRTLIFKDITKDCLQDSVDKIIKKWNIT